MSNKIGVFLCFWLVKIKISKIHIIPTIYIFVEFWCGFNNEVFKFIHNHRKPQPNAVKMNENM